MTVNIICADARDALARFPDGHFHCCVTSPPYWSLRDYGLEPTVWGGDGCEHEWGEESYQRRSNDGGSPERKQETNVGAVGRDEPVRHAFCRRCNAWRGTLGLEPTPELYVQHLVGVMREVRRVLRDDGTLWLNLGDCYASQGGHASIEDDGRQNRAMRQMMTGIRASGIGLKPKDLVGVPWRVAFALQADGWWLRSDIIWSKPNPMPESVRDRPTRSHEHLFLLTKAERYYMDMEAIREPVKPWNEGCFSAPSKHESNTDSETGYVQRFGQFTEMKGANRRSVWEIATQPYPGAHFAVFPEKLVEPCILAGTSEWGCCPECGAPWERVVERHLAPTKKAARTFVVDDRDIYADSNDQGSNRQKDGHRPGWIRADNTIGWRPACKHGAEPVPCRVLDCFGGSGTVGVVAERLGRHSVLIDAKEEYCEMARHRTAQRGLMAEAT